MGLGPAGHPGAGLPFFCPNGDPLSQPPPAHMGIPPYQLDAKTAGSMGEYGSPPPSQPQALSPAEWRRLGPLLAATEGNAKYALIKHPDGRESTVSTRHLALMRKDKEETLPDSTMTDAELSKPQDKITSQENDGSILDGTTSESVEDDRTNLINQTADPSLSRPPMYPFSPGQYPYPMLSPEMSQVAATWHTPSMYPLSPGSGFRSPYPTSLPIPSSGLSGDFYRFSPTGLIPPHPGLSPHPPHHLASHPAIVTAGPKQELPEINHRYFEYVPIFVLFVWNSRILSGKIMLCCG
ncbi:hypothetical protein HHI36_020646 [Cryptolaemus montrouzieri]|uniref:Uncharacterized protein n=1 Tax=Cryptolaemus montrouzieri TaxID=559131 RepID=A0ABD2NB49_9CUCU